MTEDSGSIFFIVFTADSPGLCLENPHRTNF